MKLIIVIMTAFLMQVSASTSAQLVTLKSDYISLKQAFAEIRKQTGYIVLYKSNMISKAKPIKINLISTPLEEAVRQMLSGQDLDFSIKNNSVIIRRKEPSFFENLITRFQAIDVRGFVYDENGYPLPGVSIKVKDGNQAVSTDAYGAFFLKGVPDDAVLVISYIGYTVKEVKANSNLDQIRLEASISKLDEVQVIAYGITSKRLNTGSVGTIKAADIEKQPVSNPLQALQGRISGIQISQSTGVPGGAFNVFIRGRSSISNGSAPLYIVDGVPFPSTSLSANEDDIITNSSPLNSINPSEIESIDILKDADATAIYGSRGANGVILITTKKGKTGQTNVDVNVYSGAGKVSRRLDVLNTQQYLEMRREAFRNDEATPSSDNAIDLLEWDQTKDTDWQEKLIGGTARMTNIQASVSGGTTNTQFIFGGGSLRETTVFPGDFADQKVSGHLNINHSSGNRKFTVSLSARYLEDKNDLPAIDVTGTAVTTPPNAPDFIGSDGAYNFSSGELSNPYVSLENKFKITTRSLISNAVVGYQLLPGLNFKSNFGFTNIHRDEVQTHPNLDPLSSALASSEFANNGINTWIAEPQISWTKQLDKNKFDVLIGTTFQEDISEGQNLRATGYASNTLLENIQAASDVLVRATNYTQYKYNAFFGRINYNRDDKYILNLTARRDGSSRFGVDKQFSNFGAMGAAWIFSKEKLVEKTIPFLSYGKIRASYGITGNDQIGDYAHMETWSITSYPYQGIAGLEPTQLVNPEYAWEKNRKLEMALELGFFKDRVLLGAAFYRNRSSNQLIGRTLALSTGFTFVQANSPATVQNSGWEFELNTVNIKSTGFNWSSSFNITVPRNKLLSYPNLQGSERQYNLEIGKSLDVYKAWHLSGVDAQTGVYQFEDYNKDGELSYAEDLQTIKEVGQKFYGGIQNTFNYKGFQLDVLFQFARQTQYNYLNTFVTPGLLSNQPAVVMNRWQNPGDVTDIQKFTSTLGSPAWFQYFIYSRIFGDNKVSDASFVRLKNLSFSYQLPGKWKENLHLKNAKIYVQGQNLLTFTDFLGMDPENGNIGNLPALRMLTAGIQITF